MTLQECKDKIAEKHGLNQWLHVEHYNIEQYMEEVAELYATEQKKTTWDEACKAQKHECVEAFKSCPLNNLYSELESILNAPKPEYKL